MAEFRYIKFWSPITKNLVFELFSSQDLLPLQKEDIYTIWRIKGCPKIRVIERLNGFSILPFFTYFDLSERNLKQNYGIELYSSLYSCFKILIDKEFREHLLNGSIGLKIIEDGNKTKVNIYVPSFYISSFLSIIQRHKPINLFNYKSKKIAIDKIKIADNILGRVSTNLIHKNSNNLESLYVRLDEYLETAFLSSIYEPTFFAISKDEILSLPNLYDFRYSKEKYVISTKYKIDNKTVYVPLFIIKKRLDNLTLLTVSGILTQNKFDVIDYTTNNPIAFLIQND